MAVDAEALKLEPWAEDGDRADPETFGLSRSTGWTVAYEQVGGEQPEREVWNQLRHELSRYFLMRRAHGIGPWHAGVNYAHTADARAFVLGSDGLIYRSTRTSGPVTGIVQDPVDDSTRVAWEPY